MANCLTTAACNAWMTRGSPLPTTSRPQQIEVIIYYDELAVIVANHPRYDVMYGDLTPIDAEMTAFLAEHCEEEITVFSDASYGTNLAPLIDTRPWPIHIFQGDNSAVISATRVSSVLPV